MGQRVRLYTSGSWMSPSPTTRTGTRATRQSVPGQQLRPLATSQRQPCHGQTSSRPTSVPLDNGPPLCGQLLSTACRTPSTLARAYQRSPARTCTMVPGGTSSRRATVTYSIWRTITRPADDSALRVHQQALDLFSCLGAACRVDLFDVPGRGHGGGRRVADGIRDLPHILAAHVANHVQARYGRFHLVIGDEKAPGVLRKLRSKDLAVGQEANVDEGAA